MSCGIYGGVPVLDLDYAEDSAAGADANFVMTDAGGLVEVQGSAEGATFTRAQLDALLDLAERGTSALFAAQRVPPSACSTSQSTVICRSPSATRSIPARRLRPISRWISWVRPDCLPAPTPTS